MPSLSDIGKRIELKDLLVYDIKKKMGQWNLSIEETDAINEFCDKWLEEKDSTIDKKDIMTEVLLRHSISKERIGTLYNLLFPPFSLKKQQH